MYFSFSCGEKKNEGSVEYSTLLVTNVGVGPAVEIALESEPIDDGRVHYPLIMARDMNVMRRSENMLKPSEEGQISICIDFNFDPITEMTCSEMMPEALMKSGLGSKYIEILEKYKSFDMILLLKYCDLFHNRFLQELKMRVGVFVANEKNTDKAKYKAEMYLEEVGNPIKIEGV